MRTLGASLKLLREEKDLQQKELAVKLNVHKGSISNWETDKRSPDKEMIVKIADFFGVSTDYLLGRTDLRNSFELKKNKENILELTSSLIEFEDINLIELYLNREEKIIEFNSREIHQLLHYLDSIGINLFRVKEDLSKDNVKAGIAALNILEDIMSYMKETSK